MFLGGQALQVLLKACSNGYVRLDVLDEAFTEYFLRLNEATFVALRDYFKDDSGALVWINYFAKDVQMMKVEYLTISDKEAQGAKQPVASLKLKRQQLMRDLVARLTAQQTYLLPLLERLNNS